VFLGVLIILAAICTGVGRLLLPEMHRYRFEIQELLSDRLGQAVRIRDVSGSWVAGPRVQLNNLDIVTADGKIAAHFKTATMVMDALRWITGGNFVSLTVTGAKMDFRADDNGAIRVGGVAFQPTAEAQGTVYQVLTSGAIEFEDATLSYQHAGMVSPLHLAHVDLELRSGEGFQISAPSPGFPSGRIELRGRLPGIFSQKPVSGRVYGKFEQVDLGATLGKIPWLHALLGAQADAEFWLQLESGHLVDARWRGALNQVRLDAPDQHEATIEHLDGTLAWMRDTHGWRLAVAPFTVRIAGHDWPQDHLLIRRSGDQYSVLAEYARLDDLALFAKWLPGPENTIWPHGALAAVAGELRDLHVEYNAAQGRFASLQARFSGLVLPAALTGGPLVQGLDGRLRMQSDVGSVSVGGAEVHVLWPDLFRGPVDLRALAANISWRLGADGSWQRASYAVNFDYAGSAVSSDGKLYAKPTAYTDARFNLQGGASIAAIRRILPLSMMNPSLAEWLPAALRDGTFAGASGVLRGELADWPFPRHEGVIDIEARFKDLSLDYAPDWPAGEHMDLVTRLYNQEMTYAAQGGHIGTLAMDGLTATMPQVDRPSLDLLAGAHTQGGGIQSFLLNSPLQETFSAYLGELKLSGDAVARIHMQLPLGQTPGQARVRGDVDLRHARLANRAGSFALEDITTLVGFTSDGISVPAGTARYGKVPVSWRLGAGSAAEAPGATLTASLAGKAALAQLWPGGLSSALATRLDGVSNWQASLFVNDIQGPVEVHLGSNLVGTQSSLPAPLNKPAMMPLPFDMTFLAPVKAGDAVSLGLGNIAKATVVLPKRGLDLRYDVAFGVRRPEDSPRGKHLGGNIGFLDADGWRDLFAGAATPAMPASIGTALQPDSIDVQLGGMHLFSRRFPALNLSGMEKRHYWGLNISGPLGQGTLRLPLPEAKSDLIVGDFARLQWPMADADMSSSGAVTDMPPPLQLAIQQFRLGDYALGKLQLEAFPGLDNYHVERLRFVTDQQQVNISGDWNPAEPDSRSVFKIRANTSNLGELLTRFGFADVIRGAPGTLDASLEWPAAPWLVEPGKLSGTLSMDVGKGRFVDVQPGAGRLLGLVSLAALPRRLALDFSDFFGQGLSFDSIKGEFVMRRGVAETEDFHVAAPAADIALTGSTDLGKKTYDQEVRVTPNMSGTLPLVGGLAGGPAAAAILLVIQQALKKPMGNMTENTYHGTGPWAKPDITLVKSPVVADGNPGAKQTGPKPVPPGT